jgi:hypothetical protein
MHADSGGSQSKYVFLDSLFHRQQDETDFGSPVSALIEANYLSRS